MKRRIAKLICCIDISSSLNEYLYDICEKKILYILCYIDLCCIEFYVLFYVYV